VAFQAFSQSSLTVPASTVRFNSNVRPHTNSPRFTSHRFVQHAIQRTAARAATSRTRPAPGATARSWDRYLKPLPATVGSARVRWHSRDRRVRSTANDWAASQQLQRKRAAAALKSSTTPLFSRAQRLGAMQAQSRVPRTCGVPQDRRRRRCPLRFRLWQHPGVSQLSLRHRCGLTPRSKADPLRQAA
jgi:hypothetical protein